MEAEVEEVELATLSRRESALEAQDVDFPMREEEEEEVSWKIYFVYPVFTFFLR